MKALWALAAGLGAGALLALGARLLGEGLSPIPIVAFALLAAGEAGLSRDGERRPDSLRVRVGAGLSEALGSALLLALELACVAGPLRHPLGIGLVLLGGALRLLAIHRLGAAFVSGPEVARAQALEQGGVYRLARHPSEVGLILVATGAVSMTPTVACALLAAGFTASAIWRVQREDAVLAAEFGPAFDAYRRRVGALGPKL
ncbi:MAG: isoprenylcysteine carboxylmethyltransferase family protein [Deltaproteobacteria bacterium]|nr:isoprenylcysteine carboxylmethyltransferase family protein [Deltaproteobacteria bacterium]